MNRTNKPYPPIINGYSITRRKFVAGGIGALALPLGPKSLFAAQKKIHIVYATSFLPLSYKDTDGQMTGFYVDLFDSILGREMGFKVVHEGLPWKRAQSTVEKGEADSFCTNATDKRRAYMNFCEEQVIENRRVAIYRRGGILDTGSNEEINLADLKQLSHVSYLGNGWAKENLKGFDVDWSPDSSAALKMVVHKRSDVFVTGEYQSRYRIKLLNYSNKLRFRPIVSKKRSLHRFGLRKSYSDSKRITHEFCDRLKNMKQAGDFDGLLSKYV